MSKPNAARLELTAALLTNHYVVQRWTAQQIAAKSGWSSQYVRDRLREYGIAVRPTDVPRGLRDIDQIASPAG